MQTTLTPPLRPTTSAAPRVVEISRGTAHPDHVRTRELVVQSLLLRAERIGARRA